jgi:uncharacterized membrane protein
VSLPDDAESAAHFTRRFESFTDVVFGFSLSFLAGRLLIPADAHDIFAQPAGIIGFLISFGFLAALWMLNHRMFRYYFAPTVPDIVLVFVELCGVALIPYALQVFLRFPNDAVGFSFYVFVYAAILASSAVVGFRGFRRNWQNWNLDSRIRRWHTPLIQSAAAALLALSASLSLAGVAHAQWVSLLIPLVIAGLRRLRILPAYARS